MQRVKLPEVAGTHRVHASAQSHQGRRPPTDGDSLYSSRKWMLLLILPVILIWGGNFAVMRVGVDEVGPFTLAAMRFFIASVPLVFFVKRPDLPISFIAIFAATFGLGQFGILFWAINLGLPSGMASLLVQLQVILTPIFALIALNQRISVPTAGAIMICLVGLSIILSASGSSGPLPLAMGVLAAMSWGASNAVVAWGAHHRMTYNPVGLVIWASAMLPLPFALLAAVTGELAEVTGGALLSAMLPAIYLGLIATVVAYFLWVKAIATYSATAVAPFSLLIPIIGLMLGSVLFDEHVGMPELAGTAFIIAGIVIHMAGLRFDATRQKQAQ